MKFRPDIEGLRALAIVPVVVYHAWPGVLPGGFAGVDIFFVISGYLITTLLLQRLQAGTYSIASFYAARVRRIFPALFAMLALVVPVCVLLLEPAALREFARLLGATSLFASNIELSRLTGYFEGAADLKPLLHTWSLAVEEQYYIVFPPLLALLWRHARRWIGAVLAVVALVSLGYCLRLMLWGSELAFYAAPARTFELMVGSGLAWWLSRPSAQRAGPAWLSGAVAAMALLALLAALVFMRADRAFPGPAALWPCLATAALIWAGSQHRGVVTTGLGWGPLRWLGAHSFSLYLWHWPVLALMRHALLDRPTPLQALGGVLLSLVLAWASLRWIETPVRQSSWSQRRMLTVGALAIMVSLGVAWGLSSLADRAAAAPGRAAELRAGAVDFSPDRARCHATGKRWLAYEQRCIFGSPQASSTLAVWGDSHGVELARAIGDVAVDRRVAQITASSCPPALGFLPPGRPMCAAHNRALLDGLVADPEVDVVLLVARHEYYLRGPAAVAYRDGFARSVALLRQAGKRVLILDPVPTYHYPVPAALAQRALRGDDPVLQGQRRAAYEDQQAKGLSLVASLAQGAGAERVPVAPVFCPAERCEVLSGGRSLYFDDNHLSMTGATRLAPMVLRLAGPPRGSVAP